MLEKVCSALLESKEDYLKAAAAAAAFVKNRKGATGTITRYIQENRLLTN
jgi:hypothetical protein